MTATRIVKHDLSLLAQQIGVELLHEHDYSQQLLTGHTVWMFCLAKGSAGKCNYMLLAFVIQLDNTPPI